MYSVTVEYPRTEGSHFDINYYRDSHIPLCEKLLAEHGYKGYLLRVDAGKAPGKGDLLWAGVVLLFESVEQMEQGFASVGDQINGDVPNFTNVKPAVSFAPASLSVN